MSNASQDEDRHMLSDEEKVKAVPQFLPTEVSSTKVDPKVGFALDTAAAAARFAADVVPKQESVQGRITKKISRSMQRLRDIDMNDEWPDAVLRANHVVDTANKGVKDDVNEMIQEASADILRRVSERLDDVRDTVIQDHTKQAESAFSTVRLTSDLLARDSRRIQGLCLLFFVLFLVAWELLILVISRPKDCRSYVGTAGGEDLLECYNAKDLLLNLDCNNYKCAVPWTEDQGDERCTSCNCGGVCSHCTECLCTVGFGPSQHQICKPFENWPGEWAQTVRWVIAGFWIALFVLFAIRYFIVWYVGYRGDVVLVDKEQRQAAESHKLKRKMRAERREMMGTHVEFFDEPGGIYHPDIVKAAVMQRMEERQIYKMPDQERVADKVGEGVDALAGIVSSKIHDVKDYCTTAANPELNAAYATTRHKVEEHNEKVRKARRDRQVGTTLSSLMVNLGDPWLKETENGDVVPASGELYNLYHKVHDQYPGGATPDLLVKEMYNAKGIHASLPFLRKFLLREPARNQLPITWREFYSEVCLAKDFIHQLRRGGADIGHYLTTTSEYVFFSFVTEGGNRSILNTFRGSGGGPAGPLLTKQVEVWCVSQPLPWVLSCKYFYFLLGITQLTSNHTHHSGLWGNCAAKDRPSQASALLEIAKQLAPLMSADDDSDDSLDGDDDKKKVDMREIVAGTAPYVFILIL